MTVGMDVNFTYNNAKYCMQYGDAKMHQTPAYFVMNSDIQCHKESVDPEVCIEGFVDYKLRWNYGNAVKPICIEFFINEEADCDDENMLA